MISSLQRRASAAFAFVAAAAFPYLAVAAPASLGDIRDIRGPIAIPPWWRWPLAIALTLIVATGVVLFVRWWRTRAPQALSPIEHARLSLTAAEDHARAGRSREWAEVVAETARGALAARLGTDILPQTTGELSQASWTKPPASDEIDATRLLALLATCDLARFAKARLDTGALLAETAVARQLTERLFAPPVRGVANAAPPAETVLP